MNQPTNQKAHKSLGVKKMAFIRRYDYGIFPLYFTSLWLENVILEMASVI